MKLDQVALSPLHYFITSLLTVLPQFQLDSVSRQITSATLSAA